MFEKKIEIRILVVIPAYNEEGKIGLVVSSIPKDKGYSILVIDDNSSDNTSQEAAAAGADILKNSETQGVGSVIRRGVEYAKEKSFSIVVVMAGNSKDDGRQIERLTDPIINNGYDFVQGSRFLKKGFYGRMPLYRLIATKYVHPLLFSFFCRKRITDSTNGFRAIKMAVLDDKRIDLYQDWLNKYELEPYLFFKVINLGYRVTEAAVSKIYPTKKISYTKMRPIIDWWLILKPIFLLGLGLKK